MHHWPATAEGGSHTPTPASYPLTTVALAGHDILLDGHHRWQIIQEYGLAFQTTEVKLANRQAAINWIINNQLGRRNLTPTQASYLRGKRYEAEKLDAQDNLLQNSPIRQNDGSEHTADRLADEYGVNRRTIERDAQFARAVDTVAKVAGET